MLAGQGVIGYSTCAEDGPDADEYAVYAALFAEKVEDKEGKQIVLENATVVHDTFSGNMDRTSIEKLFRLPSIKDAIDDFITKNRKPSVLTDQFKLKATIVLITNSDVKRMFHDSIDGGWDLFHASRKDAASDASLKHPQATTDCSGFDALKACLCKSLPVGRDEYDTRRECPTLLRARTLALNEGRWEPNLHIEWPLRRLL